MQAKSTMLQLSASLQELEIASCQGMINDDRRNLLTKSASARQRLEAEASAQRVDLTTHLLSNNKAHEGIITFLKANASLDIRPDPINLKEALQYIMDHEDYASTGFELYDFIDADVDVQYNKIMQILRGENRVETLQPIMM